jgi:hypothetical protein
MELLNSQNFKNKILIIGQEFINFNKKCGFLRNQIRELIFQNFQKLLINGQEFMN